MGDTTLRDIIQENIALKAEAYSLRKRNEYLESQLENLTRANDMLTYSLIEEIMGSQK